MVVTIGGGKRDVVITGDDTIVGGALPEMVVIGGLGAVKIGGGTRGVEVRTGGGRLVVIRHGAVRKAKDSPDAREVERTSIRVCVSSHSET